MYLDPGLPPFDCEECWGLPHEKVVYESGARFLFLCNVSLTLSGIALKGKQSCFLLTLRDHAVCSGPFLSWICVLDANILMGNFLPREEEHVVMQLGEWDERLFFFYLREAAYRRVAA